MSIQDLMRRLAGCRGWIALQFAGVALIALAGLAWTRLPEKYVWQVALSILLPVLLIAAFLALQAGTMRRLQPDAAPRARFVSGALILLAWAVAAWIAWTALDPCDASLPQWASLIHSQLPAAPRAQLLTEDRILSLLTWVAWLVRWVALPAVLLPLAVTSSVSGWRLPWLRVLRVECNWRWRAAVFVAAMLSVALPGHFFAQAPHGTASAQLWTVCLKLAATYAIGLSSWILLLAWSATLVGRQPQPADAALDRQASLRLIAGSKWIWYLLALTAVATPANGLFSNADATSAALSALSMVVLLVAGFVLATGLLRAMWKESERKVHFVEGTCCVLFWLTLMEEGIRGLYWLPSFAGVSTAFVLVGLLPPIALTAATAGFRLPMRGILRVWADWRWWLSYLLGSIVTDAIPSILKATQDPKQPASTEWHIVMACLALVFMLTWIVLFAISAVLFERHAAKPAEAQPAV